MSSADCPLVVLVNSAVLPIRSPKCFAMIR